MKTVIFTVAIYSLLVIAILVGEIRCIVKACQCNWDPVGKAEVIYTVSACTGLGMVVGYINIEDK